MRIVLEVSQIKNAANDTCLPHAAAGKIIRCVTLSHVPREFVKLPGVLIDQPLWNNGMMSLSYVRQDRLTWLIALASFVSWGVSLLLPAITLGSFSIPGWQFLMQGWKGLATLNVGGLSWLANPLLVLSWLAFTFPTYRQIAPICAGLALLAALTSFLFNLLGGAEAGLLISGYDVGFYLWLGSAVLQAAASMLQMKLKTQRGALSA